VLHYTRLQGLPGTNALAYGLLGSFVGYEENEGLLYGPWTIKLFMVVINAPFYLTS
jgi:hypothetical protein